MLRPLQFLLWALTRAVLWLRYRIRARGLEQVRGLAGPTLVLPNHPALIDPVLVLAVLWPPLRPRPMMYEGNFQNPVLFPLMKLLNAVRVPDLEQASVQARARAQEAVATVVEGLKKGETHILWPAGRLERDGVERLGGARAVADILQAVPDAKVVLVRTRGVWGSMFSFAQTGQHPHLLGRLFAGLGWLLANFLFFMPRRRVEMTVERVDRDRLPGLTREELNPWLEEWYNAGGPEAPTYVPYHFLFGRRTFEFPKRSDLADADLSKVKPPTREEVAHILADKLGRPLTAEEQRPETTLDQLGLDSLDRMELTLTVEQRFGFSADESPATVGQLWALAQGLVERGPPKPAPPEWSRPPSDTKAEIVGDTIPEAFVRRALASRKDVACADDLAGAMTYEKLLVGALSMARRFAKVPAENVGLMLPASVACDVALLGLYLAGKLPVVLNWTTGPGNLAHAARLMNLTHVVSSRAFLDRSGVTLEGVDYLLMEELRQGVGRWELLRTLLGVRFFPGRVRGAVPRAEADRPAVVLFTSGSEKAPKAVPLTHTNILSDLRAALPHFGLTRRDSILGFLPAFHSFGLSVTGLFPLLSGIRVARHPDPTDAGGLARKVASYRPTIMAGTPTFVSYVLDRAKPEQLTSLRLVVVGAEKCPQELFERCARVAPGATLLEGYGITECSPVVSANRPDDNRPGTIGKPLPGVEVAVVDLESDAALPAGEQGMLLVSGPTVFPGYLGHDGPQPFRQREGKRWYVTGDLAKFDADGFLHFAGRLKRFIKAGGEMISLPALEEPFARRYPPTADGPRVAVEGVETEGGRRIVLFSTEPLELREANKLLEQEGFRGVLRLDEVRRVPSIPVLGTGKTDYKVLRQMITAPAKA